MSDQPIEIARDALERHAWKDAYEALAEADRAETLPGTALEMLAWASYWTGRPDETVEALERAYAAYLLALLLGLLLLVRTGAVG